MHDIICQKNEQAETFEDVRQPCEVAQVQTTIIVMLPEIIEMI